jgi:hypothetical protein
VAGTAQHGGQSLRQKRIVLDNKCAHDLDSRRCPLNFGGDTVESKAVTHESPVPP